MPKSKVMKTFGQRMTEARKAKGWTIRDLEERSGVHNANLTAYELDRHEPRLFYLVCIADALEVSLDWLAGRNIDENIGGIKEMGNWISVNEKLPKRSKCVLLTDGETVWAGFLTVGHKWVRLGFGCVCGVTHWMELPEPPREE